MTGGELTFAPDPSSSGATVGGSIANDACSNHSLAHGRMSHHVHEIELVTSDGAHLIAVAGGLGAVDKSDTVAVARARALNDGLGALVRDNLGPIRTEFEKAPATGLRLPPRASSPGAPVPRATRPRRQRGHVRSDSASQDRPGGDADVDRATEPGIP